MACQETGGPMSDVPEDQRNGTLFSDMTYGDNLLKPQSFETKAFSRRSGTGLEEEEWGCTSETK